MNQTTTVQTNPGGWREIWHALTHRYVKLDLPYENEVTETPSLEEVRQRVAEYQARLRSIAMSDTEDT